MARLLPLLLLPLANGVAEELSRSCQTSVDRPDGQCAGLGPVDAVVGAPVGAAQSQAECWSWRRLVTDIWLFAPLCLVLLVGFRFLPPEVAASMDAAVGFMQPYEGTLVEGEELENLRAFVDAQCRPHADRYGFALELRSAYRVHKPEMERRLEEFQSSLRTEGKPSNQQRMFHGTTASAARAILSTGFALPRRAGMFGKGIYFADCPLKSWQYCRWYGPMLVCDVELGTSKIQRTSKSNMEPERDFQRGWLMRMLGNCNYDSVTARSCVRVPEYVIYRPEQVVPRYVLVLKQKEKA